MQNEQETSKEPGKQFLYSVLDFFEVIAEQKQQNEDEDLLLQSTPSF